MTRNFRDHPLMGLGAAAEEMSIMEDELHLFNTCFKPALFSTHGLLESKIKSYLV